MGNEVYSSDFLKVLMALKTNIKKDLKVAEVARVVQINGEAFNCQLLSDSSTVSCAKLQNLEISTSDIVLILFTDTDFRSNLKRAKMNNVTQNVESELHTKNYGVIIGIIYKEVVDDSES